MKDKKMGIILSIETATFVCSVAVHREGVLLGSLELFQENVHGQKLMPLVDSLLSHIGLQPGDLDAVAVSAGPGSYTGLRIGASTAKGLAYALEIPLIAVGSLDALARRAAPFVAKTDYIVPMIDARRMEVYCKVLDGEMNEIEPLSPRIIEEVSFDSFLRDSKVVFLGDANKKVEEVIQHDHALFIPCLNSACTVGEIAALRYRDRRFEDLAYFEPNYLKEFRVLQSKK